MALNQLIGKRVIRSLDIIKTCEIQYDTNQPCVAIDLSNCKEYKRYTQYALNNVYIIYMLK